MGFLGGITNAISSAVKNVSSVVSGVAKAVTSVATPILNQAKDIFSTVAKGAGALANLTGMKMPFGLPNPLQALSGLAQGIQFGAGGIGDVLKQLGSMLGGAKIDGNTITLPSLGDRGGAVAQAGQAIVDALAGGSATHGAAPVGGGTPPPRARRRRRSREWAAACTAPGGASSRPRPSTPRRRTGPATRNCAA